jgi:type IV pilus assembly protein PilA
MRQEDSKSNSILAKGCGCLSLSLFSLIFFGIIIAIALPSFLNKANKAKQSEAKQYVGSMNRAQQAKFAENGTFATSVDALGLGIKTETTNYKYSLRVTKQAAFNYGVSKQEKLPSYVGGVLLVGTEKEKSTISLLCEADSPGTIEPAEPIYQNGKVVCGKGTTEVTK